MEEEEFPDCSTNDVEATPPLPGTESLTPSFNILDRLLPKNPNLGKAIVNDTWIQYIYVS